eukprot:7348889-Prorocentrum_lima.AAC.1
MPDVREEGETIYANAAGRVQLRHPPLAGQAETYQEFPLAQGVERRDDLTSALVPMGAIEQ